MDNNLGVLSHRIELSALPWFSKPFHYNTLYTNNQNGSIDYIDFYLKLIISDNQNLQINTQTWMLNICFYIMCNLENGFNSISDLFGRIISSIYIYIYQGIGKSNN